MVVVLLPSANAQLTLGEKAEQKKIDVSINNMGDIHVVHVIKPSTKIRSFEPINGTVLNMKIIDANGEEVQHGVLGGDEKIITLFPSTGEIFIEYDLNDVLFLKDGVWTWNFRHLEDTTFDFPDEVDVVFVNKRPIKVDENKLRCHGCEMFLEYIINEPVTQKKVDWEGKQFQVSFRTLSDVNMFNFSQPTKSISFETPQPNKPITVIIPLKLLWSPYDVSLNNQTITDYELFQNSTHAWVTIYPKESGDVKITGTTVIPEFPVFVPLALGIIMILILPLKNRINRH